uniref:Uncharacterized protein n=1 Tax=Strigamia maritima TaxID=126957 RepID=T1J5J0_STRMM
MYLNKNSMMIHTAPFLNRKTVFYAGKMSISRCAILVEDLLRMILRSALAFQRNHWICPLNTPEFLFLKFILYFIHLYSKLFLVLFTCIQSFFCILSTKEIKND